MKRKREDSAEKLVSENEKFAARPRSPLTRPPPTKRSVEYDTQFIVAGMCLYLMRETEHVRICSERIDRVLQNPQASVLWNGDGRSPMHLGMEHFDILVPSHGNPFQFNIDDTFVKHNSVDPRDLYDADGEKIVKKLKVDLSSVRRVNKDKTTTTTEPESPDAVWDITSTIAVDSKK